MYSRKRSRLEIDDGVLGKLEVDSSVTLQNNLCASERKRKLERNRRNLVNTRFEELDCQLAELPGAPKRVHRRLDKAVVLKDATQALASLQLDLEYANSRLQVMTSEQKTLRSEKLELRRDKAYLHNELATARAQSQSRESDTIRLWQVLCSSKDFRNSVPADISKVPQVNVLGTTSAAQKTQPKGNDVPTLEEKQSHQAKTTAELFVEQLVSSGAPVLFPVDLDTPGTPTKIGINEFDASCSYATLDGEEFTDSVDGSNASQESTIVKSFPHPLSSASSNITESTTVKSFPDPLSSASPNIAQIVHSADVAPSG